MRDGQDAVREAMMVEGRDGWAMVIIPDGTDTAQFAGQLLDIGYDAPKGTQPYLGDEAEDVFPSPDDFLEAVRTGQHRGRMNAPAW